MIDLEKLFAYKEPSGRQINELLSMYAVSIFMGRVIVQLLPESEDRDTLIREVAEVMRKAQKLILPPV